MEIRKYIQITPSSCFLFLLCVLGLAACRNHTNDDSNARTEIDTFTGMDRIANVDNADYSSYIHENLSMRDALQLAKKENKMLWTVIGGTETCGYTKEFLQILTKTGFFKKYQDKFIFHTCNPSTLGNEHYFQILNPQALPNSYIFHNNGEVISLYDFYGQSPVKFANSQIESVLNESPYNPSMMKDYSMGGKRLLRHLEKLINIGDKSLSNNRDTLLAALHGLQDVDSLSRNYYYYYLSTQIAGKLGDTSLLNKYADTAYMIFAEKSSIRWAGLNDNIKQYSASYHEDQTKSAKLVFEKEVIKYGKIKIGKIHESSFTVENLGKAPLIILGTHTSCDCVQIKYPKAPILPGKKATVKIDYHASVKGVFLKSILFRSNAANRVQKIIVEGEVI